MGREAEKHTLVMQRESRSTEAALVLPLDLLFRTETVVLVKVDTQGAEESVLGGMQPILQHNVVLLVLLEELRVDLVDVLLGRAGAHGEHVGLPRRAFVQ